VYSIGILYVVIYIDNNTMVICAVSHICAIRVRNFILCRIQIALAMALLISYYVKMYLNWLLFKIFNSLQNLKSFNIEPPDV
jgi:hypothetical protein